MLSTVVVVHGMNPMDQLPHIFEIMFNKYEDQCSDLHRRTFGEILVKLYQIREMILILGAD